MNTHFLRNKIGYYDKMPSQQYSVVYNYTNKDTLVTKEVLAALVLQHIDKNKDDDKHFNRAVLSKQVSEIVDDMVKNKLLVEINGFRLFNLLKGI